MAVSGKNKVRKRYIAFVLKSHRRPRRGEMIHTINVALPQSVPRSSVQLTVFDGEVGIVLCQHIHKDEVMRALGRIRMAAGSPCAVETVTTSGTIKQARLKLEKRVRRSLKVNRPIKELNNKRDNNKNRADRGSRTAQRGPRHEQSKRNI